jgi:hypothetical protein
VRRLGHNLSPGPLIELLSQHFTFALNYQEKNPEERRSNATSIFIYSCEFGCAVTHDSTVTISSADKLSRLYFFSTVAR